MADTSNRSLSEYSDEELALELAKTMERHDRLVDSVDMGDERIYFAGKRCDAIRAEQNRRGYKPCSTCNDDGDVHRIDGEWLGYCHCFFGQKLKAEVEAIAARKAGA